MSSDLPRTYVLSGGGTGGHITPILAVASALKQQDPTCNIVYVGEKGGKFADLTANHEAIDVVHTIWAGKLRRFHGRSVWDHITDIRLMFFNIRDILFLLIGCAQSVILLLQLKPQAIFLKGGFVGVPVGLAGALLRRPLLTHDSDAIPGLANRIVSRFVRTHAVSMEPALYPYPVAKTTQVGVLVEPGFQPVGSAEQAAFRHDIAIPVDATVLLITGSSSGAQRLNEAVMQIVDQLLTDYPSLHIVHQTGRGFADIYGEYRHDRLQVVAFMRPMYAYTGAADIVVARASANTLAELGTQNKPVIAVPNPFLTAGHQLKNAQILEQQNAIISVTETIEGTNAAELDLAIRTLLNNPTERAQIAGNLHRVTMTGAADTLAKLLIQAAAS